MNIFILEQTTKTLVIMRGKWKEWMKLWSTHSLRIFFGECKGTSSKKLEHENWIQTCCMISISVDSWSTFELFVNSLLPSIHAVLVAILIFKNLLHFLLPLRYILANLYWAELSTYYYFLIMEMQYEQTRII